MPSVNEVKLSGYIYKPTESHTTSGKTITRFGMKVWCGKDKDGKNVYDFVNCKCFEHILNTTGEFDFTGRVTVESWEKDGVKHKNVVFLGDLTPKTFNEPAKPKQDDNPFDDDIPDFN